MPTNLIEVDEFTADVSVPVGSDARTAASVRTPFQALANRTKFLEARRPATPLYVDNTGAVKPDNLGLKNVEITGGLRFTAAFLKWRLYSSPTNGAFNFTPIMGDIIVVPDVVPSVARVCTLVTDAAYEGAIVRVLAYGANAYIKVVMYLGAGGEVDLVGYTDVKDYAAEFLSLGADGWRRIG